MREWTYRIVLWTGAITLTGLDGNAMSMQKRILDAVDKLITARHESSAAIGSLVHLELGEAGSNKFFEILAGDFPAQSQFARIEIRKPRDATQHRGLIVLDIRTEGCISPRVVEERYGRSDELSPPLAGGPSNRPIYRVYKRPWGKLSFGFVETKAGDCLSSAVIDWAE